MSKQLTKEQKVKYSKNPDNCPYCDSNWIGGEEGNFEGTGANREIECSNCNEKWIEHFEMTTITAFV